MNFFLQKRLAEFVECTSAGLARGKTLARIGRKTIGIVSHAHAQLRRYWHLIWIRVYICVWQGTLYWSRHRCSYSWAMFFGLQLLYPHNKMKIICLETPGLE